MQTRPPTLTRLLAHVSLPLVAIAKPATAATITLVNGGFDAGTDGSAIISGWTDSAPSTPGFWLANDNSPGSAPDPTEAQGGSALYLSTNRLTGGAGSQPSSSTLSQSVTLDTPTLNLLAAGSSQFELDFYYFDTDSNDTGRGTVTFLDSSLATISSLTTGDLPNIGANGTSYDAVDTPWTLVNLDGAMPLNTTSFRIDISTGPRAGGSATNVHFDSFSAQLVPEPSTALLGLLGCVGLLRRRRAS
ncbi:hypothetical protein HNR46_003694 [Haloferula luteola]|uniref:PEP-CTERM protein-sorting domain-containing protein n=1 Tax=Haloferula luteola TaxID=595692 RepID=A0A840V6X7_9BACT|nr:PEP-CTERM sorting domain-containing protein [Haloferula luteola]MBB5353433.1 hypothetical protein [Haloferula luteola]